MRTTKESIENQLENIELTLQDMGRRVTELEMKIDEIHPTYKEKFLKRDQTWKIKS